MRKAILDPKTHEVVPCDIDTWVEWRKSGGSYRVAQTTVDNKLVSTVFLGIDYSFGGPPLWFETMVFPEDSWLEEYCKRYTTWDEAVAGHEHAVELVKSGKHRDD